MEDCLLVFVKNAVLGTAKTRLAATVGPQAALDAYRQLLAYTARAVAPLEADKYVCYSAAPEPSPMWEQAGCRPRAQAPGDLGQRMHGAFCEAFAAGAKRVVLVGSDCPGLSPSLLRQAFRELERKQVVLGPAEDGGYYLIGLSEPQPALFEGKAWSTDSVLADTLADCIGLKLGVALLPVWGDVDYEADWRRFAPRVEALLAMPWGQERWEELP